MLLFGSARRWPISAKVAPSGTPRAVRERRAPAERTSPHPCRCVRQPWGLLRSTSRHDLDHAERLRIPPQAQTSGIPASNLDDGSRFARSSARATASVHSGAASYDKACRTWSRSSKARLARRPALGRRSSSSVSRLAAIEPAQAAGRDHAAARTRRARPAEAVHGIRVGSPARPSRDLEMPPSHPHVRSVHI